MKITLRQHGGLAAAVKRAPVVLDTGELDEQLRAEVEGLAHAASSHSRGQAAMPETPYPDQISSTLTIDDGEGARELRNTEARSLESASSDEFAKLVQLVRKHGKPGAQ